MTLNLTTMYLYNVTVNIDQDVEEDWLLWMKTVHIPEVLATGYFLENKLFKLLHEPHNEGSTYSVQYFAPSLQDVELYLTNAAPALMQKQNIKYKDKHVAFITVMELVG